MADRPQVVRFVENYVDDETRVGYYRDDRPVKISEGEYQRASALGAVERVDAEPELELRDGWVQPIVASAEEDEAVAPAQEEESPEA